MSLPEIGAVVKDVFVSRSPNGFDVIVFTDGSAVEVPKSHKIPGDEQQPTTKTTVTGPYKGVGNGGILHYWAGELNLPKDAEGKFAYWNEEIWRDHGGK